MVSDFTGPFNIANWTQLPGDSMVINTSLTQIEFVGTTAVTNQASYMQITMPDDYIITFDWSFTPDTERASSPFGYYTDTGLVYLTNQVTSSLVTPTSGSVSLFLTKNTVFKYFKWTGPIANSTATISNFKYRLLGMLDYTVDFVGEFAPENWLINNTSTGTSIAIDSISITMDANDGPESDGTISISSNIDRIIAFEWNFNGQDTSTYDYFALYLDDNPIWISNIADSDPIPPSPSAGSVSIYLPANTLFEFLKHGDPSLTSQTVVTGFKFAPVSLPPSPVPCFALSNIIKYQLPSDANIINKNKRNNYWININDLYLTRDHVVKVDNKLLIAENASNVIINEEDDVVDIQTSDGRFITINNIDVATSKFYMINN